MVIFCELLCSLRSLYTWQLITSNVYTMLIVSIYLYSPYSDVDGGGGMFQPGAESI